MADTGRHDESANTHPQVDSEEALSTCDAPGQGDAKGGPDKPSVSLILPAYNEASILRKNLVEIYEYMRSLDGEYRWEIIVVNDGSSDETGELADEAAAEHEDVRVVHRLVNLGLAEALRAGIEVAEGDYIVTMDMDLSYSVDHIGRLLQTIRETRARIVIASPYAEGGTIANVPWARRVMSQWANRFLGSLVKGYRLSTLTGMTRAYDAAFLRSLDLKSMAMQINMETIYKTMLMRGRIEEIPAHLDWGIQRAKEGGRTSAMRIGGQVKAVLASGFFLRPLLFFVLPGLAMLAFALYVNVWMFIHFFRQYAALSRYDWFMDRASAAVASAYQQFPHTFLVGLLSLILAFQLVGLGLLSSQSKRYFEELFHLGSSIYARLQEDARRK